MSFFSNMLKA